MKKARISSILNRKIKDWEATYMVMNNPEKIYAISNNGQYYSCQYFITFCTKFNRRVFTGDYATLLQEIIDSIGEDNGYRILDVIITADVVQCVVECQPQISIYKCVSMIKTYITHRLYEEHPELRSRMPQMWATQNYISTMGNVSHKSVCEYVERLKEGVKK